MISAAGLALPDAQRFKGIGRDVGLVHGDAVVRDWVSLPSRRTPTSRL